MRGAGGGSEIVVVVVDASVVVVDASVVVVVDASVVVVVGGVVVVVVVGNGSGTGDGWDGPPGEVVVVVMTEGLVEMTLGWVDAFPGLAVEELVEWEPDGFVGAFVDEFGVLLKITIVGTAVVGTAPGVVDVGGTVAGGGVTTVVGAAAARAG
jgi:hypothetical protein